MNKDDFAKLQPQIQEFMQYMIDIGLVNTENKDKILDKLRRTKIEYKSNVPYGGYTEHEEDNTIKITICKDFIEKEAESLEMDADILVDINIFHELVHASSILDSELSGKINELFSDIDTQDNNYPLISFGYTILQEYIAQSISQKLVSKKYKKSDLFPIKHNKLIYDENGHLPKESAYSYEYDSNLVYYGELEQFALKFINAIYGATDVNRLYEDHFSGKIFDLLSSTFKNRKNGMTTLYNMFGHMGNIAVGDYYQQGYYGPEKRSWSNIDLFKTSINEFNRIADSEIDKSIQLN